MNLSDPIYTDPDAARAHLEALRWADGRFCPHCGTTEGTSPVNGKKHSHRPGLYYCNECKRTFTVTVGTLFERSHVPLHKWVMGFHLMASSKKGISAHQLHRMLGLTYKTAWFLAHRIREAMADDGTSPIGGSGKIVQADETYFGHKKGQTRRRARKNKAMSAKRSVVALVSEGQARTFHVARADVPTVRHILVTNAYRESELHTDESSLYIRVGGEFARHKTIHHSANEYVGSDGTTTNAVENYFSIFKRGMRGVYQHCGEKHLQRYLSEFDYRYNTRKLDDFQRAALAIKQTEGKRLTYRRTGAGGARP